MRVLVVILVGLMTVSTCGGFDDIRKEIKRIADEFEEREYSRSKQVQNHIEWLETEDGKKDVKFLAENYDFMDSDMRYGIPIELARTGSPAVVPLLKAALKDQKGGGRCLSGVFYACFFGTAQPKFKKELAPALIPWIGVGDYPHEDDAIELLPVLDRDLAKRTFLNEKYLSPDAPHVHFVLDSCNSARIPVPRKYVDRLLDTLKGIYDEPDTFSRNKARNSYSAAIVALAFHDPAKSKEMAEALMRKKPTISFRLADIPLIAADLNESLRRIYAYTENDESFEKLPEEAKIYFAVNYFTSDWENGGISQPLWNSTANYLPWALKGYEAIGDHGSLHSLKLACSLFGEAGPSIDRVERIQQMEAMKPDFDTQWEKLIESAPGPEKESEFGTDWLVNIYAEKHADVFKAIPDLRKE